MLSEGDHGRHAFTVAAPVYLPMLAASGAGRLRGESFAEPKLDGWRAIVTVDPLLPIGIEVRSRTGRFLTTQVPELHGLADVGFRMVLDGELVAVSDDGNVDFYRLGERMLQRLSTRADISETPTRQLLAADRDNHSDVARLTSAARPARPVRAS